MTSRENQTVNRQSTLPGILARLWWMLGGNVLLAFCLLFIFYNEAGFFHPADWVFWITVGTLVFVRYIDIQFLGGQTATGEDASTKDWTRYAVLLIGGSTVAWAVVHTANHLWGGRVAAP
jgi:uncharacterized protein YhhL (DUF1145 family)